MIDKRLLDPRFNPSSMPDGWVANDIGGTITLFDRAMLAAMGASIQADPGERYKEEGHAVFAARCAIAFLEERAKRLGIEVTP